MSGNNNSLDYQLNGCVHKSEKGPKEKSCLLVIVALLAVKEERVIDYSNQWDNIPQQLQWRLVRSGSADKTFKSDNL